MAKKGRPPKYDKDFHPDDFIRLSRLGKNKTQIAFEWEVCRDTMYDWERNHRDFSYALKKGHEFFRGYWENFFYDAAHLKRRIDLGSAIWLTKNTLGWADKQEVKQESEVKVDMEGFKFIEPKE